MQVKYIISVYYTAFYQSTKSYFKISCITFAFLSSSLSKNSNGKLSSLEKNFWYFYEVSLQVFLLYKSWKFSFHIMINKPRDNNNIFTKYCQVMILIFPQESAQNVKHKYDLIQLRGNKIYDLKKWIAISLLSDTIQNDNQ